MSKPERELFFKADNDNWKHRSANMLCTTCVFFVEKERYRALHVGKGAKGPERIIGRCRRHAPTLSGWPVMMSTDWCGDHKLDENKMPIGVDPEAELRVRAHIQNATQR